MYALLELARNIRKTTEGKLFYLVFQNKQLQSLVLHLNKEGQLRLGKQATGVNLPTYSIATQVISGGKKKAGTPYTLYDTGEFYQSFDLLVSENGITIEADTKKPDKDLEEYGDILGLTDESRQILISEILPFMRELLLKGWFKGV